MNGIGLTERPENIMVVDDTPANLQLLATVLQREGFRVRVATNGPTALQSIEKALPDLMLLDARMPEMDGYEVCRQLKAVEHTREIPVIFISGLDEANDKVKAFAVGGVDYITKPFQIPELLVRVNIHLNQNRLKRALIAQNLRLDETVRERTRELVAANERLTLLTQTRSDFLSLFAHELQNQRNGFLDVVELAFDRLPPGSVEPDLQHLYDDSRHRLTSLLDDASWLGELQLNGHGKVDGTTSLDQVMATVQSDARALGESHIIFNIPASGLGEVSGKPAILQKAILCLLETGVKCYPVGGTGEVVVGVQPASHEVIITLTTLQHTLLAVDLSCIFDLSFASKPFPGGDLGIAPALANRIITLLGGQVEIKNLVPAGLELTARLPRPGLGP